MAQEIALPLSWDEYVRHDATALAGLVRQGDVTPLELAAQAKAGVDALNPQLNAVIEVFQDVVDEPLKDGLNIEGPFGGVPYFMKDLGSGMKGRALESGFSWRADWICEEDDPLTVNYRKAGFNLMGRTTCPEDGLTFNTETIKDGITRSPWNLERTPGGSSGGSSAIVAAGIVPAASSSDGGGSTRFPAAWTGLVGLKPTRGLLPLPSGVHEAGIPSGVEGTMTRTVRDTAAIFDALYHKPQGGGFMPYPKPEASFLEATQRAHSPMRIALSKGAWSRTDVTLSASIEEGLLEMAAFLEKLGHHVEEVKDEDICDFESLFQGYMVANWTIPGGIGLVMSAREAGVELSLENTSLQALNHIEAAQKYTLEDMATAQYQNNVATRQWGAFWDKGYDLLLCPVTPIEVPTAPSPYSLSNNDPFDVWINRLVDAGRYTMPGNETGLPGISVPAGKDSHGCPFGLQFYAPWTREDRLVQIAAQIEAERPEQFNQLAPLNVTTL